jgi:hypothetical protein
MQISKYLTAHKNNILKTTKEIIFQLPTSMEQSPSSETGSYSTGQEIQPMFYGT